MKGRIRSWYQRLPLVRELRYHSGILRQIQIHLATLPSRQHYRAMETAAVTQAIEALKAGNPRYRDPLRLLVYGAQYTSQNFEDGMIAEIFRRIPPSESPQTFLEIGVGDGSENNTSVLLLRGWQGWWLEADSRSCASIRSRLAGMPSMARRLTLREALVSPGNIVALLAEMRVPAEVDLFSLDVDLDTYHLWASLGGFRPRVIVVEYNSAIPPDVSWVHPWKPGAAWDSTQAFGASLKALELLGRSFGYSLVGCDIIGVNAFFVRDDLVGDHFAGPFTAENHYEPPRYGLSYRFGHPSCLYGECHVGGNSEAPHRLNTPRGDEKPVGDAPAEQR